MRRTPPRFDATDASGISAQLEAEGFACVAECLNAGELEHARNLLWQHLEGDECPQMTQTRPIGWKRNDVTTWVESSRPRGGGGGMSKCYLTFDAEFKWTNDATAFVPVMSGGLLAMSRRWWAETGGYDAEMHGWGGENLDQSCACDGVCFDHCCAGDGEYLEPSCWCAGPDSNYPFCISWNAARYSWSLMR